VTEWCVSSGEREQDLSMLDRTTHKIDMYTTVIRPSSGKKK